MNILCNIYLQLQLYSSVIECRCVSSTVCNMFVGSADKFYELKQTESHSVTIRYGRRLSPGVTSIKAFSTAAEVCAYFH